MKIEVISKLALSDDVDFKIKSNTIKYIDNSFKGDTTVIKKVSKVLREYLKDDKREK